MSISSFYGLEFFGGEFFYPPLHANAIGVGGLRNKRCWYSIEGRRLCLTFQELAQYLAQLVVATAKVIQRKNIKRVYKTRPDREVSANTYHALMETVQSLDRFAPEANESDDEEAVMLLM